MMAKSDILAMLYILLGLLYIIHTGVNLPTQIDNWLVKNHNFIYMLIATIYTIIAIIYLYQNKKQESDSDNTTDYTIYKIIGIGIILLYMWYMLIKKTPIKNFRAFKIL